MSMKPHFQRNIIHNMDGREGMAQLPNEVVDCYVTSPPYYMLRDYGVEKTLWPAVTYSLFGFEVHIPAMECCLGLEPDPKAFIGHLLLIFREAKRTLKKTGTIWVNMGDSYATGSGGMNMMNACVQAMAGCHDFPGDNSRKKNGSIENRKPFRDKSIKPKDLFGIPWMLAFALREDGWYLRQDIIWSKPNPMPESATDRCTKSHEYLFLLSKCQQYFYDAEAIKTASIHTQYKMPDGWDTGEGSHGSFHRNGREKGKNTMIRKDTIHKDLEIPNQSANSHRKDRNEMAFTGMANKRSVWTVATKPFSEAHFATFPEELIKDCIKAGSSQHGCCQACGKPYERLVEKELVPTHKAAKTFVIDQRDLQADKQDQGSNRQKDGHKPGHIYASKTNGWRATCTCQAGVVPALIGDMFAGSGTIYIASRALGRDAIGWEIAAHYMPINQKRIHDELGMFK